MSPIIKQHPWTEAELRQAGFQYYHRQKHVVMARHLSDAETPMQIQTHDGEMLIARQGYILCYDAGTELRPTLDEYPHWPVEPAIFHASYCAWDEPDWQPTATEAHLMQLGCSPYYKSAGVWAKPLAEDTYLQSLEHDQPVLVKAGYYVAIGVHGEPYAMRPTTFDKRYTLPVPSSTPPATNSTTEQSARRGLLDRLVRFFRSN